MVIKSVLDVMPRSVFQTDALQLPAFCCAIATDFQIRDVGC
jgi:hypothetical protein